MFYSNPKLDMGVNSFSMGTHMKTTVDISDELFARARKVAEQQGTTLRRLIEEGLQLALDKRRPPSRSFQLPTVRGETVPNDILERGLHAIVLESYASREDRAATPSDSAIESIHDRA